MQTEGKSKIIKAEDLWDVSYRSWCLPSLNLEGEMEGLAQGYNELQHGPISKLEVF